MNSSSASVMNKRNQKSVKKPIKQDQKHINNNKGIKLSKRKQNIFLIILKFSLKIVFIRLTNRTLHII